MEQVKFTRVNSWKIPFFFSTFFFSPHRNSINMLMRWPEPFWQSNFKHWNRLPREVTESPSVDILKTQLGPGQLVLADSGCTRWSQVIPSNLNDSVIVIFNNKSVIETLIIELLIPERWHQITAEPFWVTFFILFRFLAELSHFKHWAWGSVPLTVFMVLWFTWL